MLFFPKNTSMSILIQDLKLQLSLNTVRTRNLPEFNCAFIFTIPDIVDLNKILRILRLNIKSDLSVQKYSTVLTDSFYYSFDCSSYDARINIYKSCTVTIQKKPRNSGYLLTLSRCESHRTLSDQQVLNYTKMKYPIILKKCSDCLDTTAINSADISTFDYHESLLLTLIKQKCKISSDLIKNIINNILTSNLLDCIRIAWRNETPGPRLLPRLRAQTPLRQSTRTTLTALSVTETHNVELPLLPPGTPGLTTSPSSGPNSQLGTPAKPQANQLPRLLITRLSPGSDAGLSPRAFTTDSTNDRSSPLSVASPAASSIALTPGVRRETFANMVDRVHGCSSFSQRRLSVIPGR